MREDCGDVSRNLNVIIGMICIELKIRSRLGKWSVCLWRDYEIGFSLKVFIFLIFRCFRSLYLFYRWMFYFMLLIWWFLSVFSLKC